MADRRSGNDILKKKHSSPGYRQDLFPAQMWRECPDLFSHDVPWLML
jgi:hypothetical protein